MARRRHAHREDVLEWLNAQFKERLKGYIGMEMTSRLRSKIIDVTLEVLQDIPEELRGHTAFQVERFWQVAGCSAVGAELIAGNEVRGQLTIAQPEGRQ